jgi:glycosyltransferase involved in cell wall biosynthesis
MSKDNLDWPQISLITPSYNQYNYISETLKSVAIQKYPNLEYIVIDGGSSDGSVEIIKEYSQHIKYWVSESDSGQTDALLKGFSRATGDILCWLNSDDVLEPNTLFEVAEFFLEHPEAEIVYGNATWIDKDSRILRSKKEHDFNQFVFLYDHNYIPQPSTFWRRSLYEKTGGLNPHVSVAMDTDFWARCLQHTKFYHVNKQWSRMRYHEEAKTHPNKMRYLARAQVKEIRRKYYGKNDPDWILPYKRLVAKTVRINLKLFSGCYF